MGFERHVLQENITLCDAKSGILLAFSTGLLGWCFDKLSYLLPDLPKAGPSLSTSEWLGFIPIPLYVLAIFAWAVTIYFAWNSVKPRIRPTADYIFWDSSVFKKPQADFANDIRAAEPDLLMENMLGHLHMLAAICREKFHYFHRAVVPAEWRAILVSLAELSRVSGLLVYQIFSLVG